MGLNVLQLFDTILSDILKMFDTILRDIFRMFKTILLDISLLSGFLVLDVVRLVYLFIFISIALFSQIFTSKFFVIIFQLFLQDFCQMSYKEDDFLNFMIENK